MDRARRRCLQALGGPALVGGVWGMGSADLPAVNGGAAALAASMAASSEARAADAHAPVHALLIGCGRYAGLGPSHQLPGAEADVSLMRRALRAAYEERLTAQTLDSADAALPPTHRAVMQALDAWSTQVPAGAIAWLYLAGHGTRRPQPVTGSAYREPDGKDEFFLPTDSGRWQEGTDSVARSIRDDEIQLRLLHLQQRGVSVVAWFDTCHAAGMDRNAASSRADGGGLAGTRARAVDISLLGGPPATLSDPGSNRASAADRRLTGREPAIPTHRDLTRLTLLYACRKHEQAFEGWVQDGQGRRQRQGWFTWYAVKAWQDLRGTADSWNLSQLQQRVSRIYEAQGIVASNPQLLGDASPLQRFRRS